MPESEDESPDPLNYPYAKRRCERAGEDASFPASEDALCETCETIDLDRIFKMRVRKNSTLVGELVAPLGALDSSSRRSSCPLCRLFATLRIDELKCSSTTENSDKYFLRAIYAESYLSPRHKINGLQHTVMLAVVPGNAKSWRHGKASYIYSSTSSEHTRQDRIMARIRSDKVDFGEVREWLEFCEKHHTDGCCEAEKVTLSGFRVIDCQTRCIVPAPQDCEYIALSYVWGNRPEEPQNAIDVLGSLAPLVIEDAIMVATNLDVRYLWVDRYCIDQNSEDKDHQIRNMDLIYRGAKLTIIAAAGEDPSFGLPGVSSTKRTPQPMLQVKGNLLISSLPDPSAELSSSKWASRGWTYQEGLLSRRRLVFTRSQVLFQCMNMHCWETISTPLHILHAKYVKRFRDCISGCRAFPPKGIGKSLTDVVRRIGEYSQKDLSFENDALNAVLGVLHAFKSAGVLANHISGIPSVPLWQRSQPQLTKRVESLAAGLSWVADSRNVNPYLKRRKNFPSWSWAGWSGVGLRHWYFLMGAAYRVRDYYADIVVELEDEDGQLVPWNFSSSLEIFPRRIYVSGWTTQLRITRAAREGNQVWALDVPDLDDKIVKLHLTADPTQDLSLERALVEQPWTGLILGWSGWFFGTFLILKATKEGTFERIGLSCPRFSVDGLSNLSRHLRGDNNEAYIGTREFKRQRLILE